MRSCIEFPFLVRAFPLRLASTAQARFIADKQDRDRPEGPLPTLDPAEGLGLSVPVRRSRELRPSQIGRTRSEASETKGDGPICILGGPAGDVCSRSLVGTCGCRIEDGVRLEVLAVVCDQTLQQTCAFSL
jgi:hypothetical protein